MSTLHIADAALLSRLATIEGDAWAARQGNAADPYSVAAFRAAWDAKTRYCKDDPSAIDEPLDSFRDGLGDVIYGAGGYSRYRVRANGEIELLAWSAPTGDYLARALLASVRVVGVR